MSVTASFVSHGQSVSVTDSLCLPQTVCVCHRQSVSVRESLCLSQTVCVCQRKSVWLFYTWFLSKFVREIWVCPSTALSILCSPAINILLESPSPPQSIPLPKILRQSKVYGICDQTYVTKPKIRHPELKPHHNQKLGWMSPRDIAQPIPSQQYCIGKYYTEIPFFSSLLSFSLSLSLY